ncbi:MAG TPA: phosphatidylserine decarboxylase [Verrucomicrobiae bacterium]|nr:phosphatidylserine decarboxylase [Verrucomicrobiae bacterium]
MWTLVALIALFVAGVVATILATIIGAISIFLIILWGVFALFTLYFFRDPNPRTPPGPNLIVSPAHGKVDIIDQVTESLFMGGPCQRISIFLSVIDVHVQNAPVSGKVAFYKYTTGQFLSALKTESAEHNENLLFGIESSERNGAKVGVRLIAGVLARRIVPFVSEGEETVRGERISLIQFGSRTDLYLPLSAKVKIKLGDRVVGGTSVMATFE